MKTAKHGRFQAFFAITTATMLAGFSFGQGQQPAADAAKKAGDASAPGEVIVLCGGSMRAAMEEIIKQFSLTSKDKVLATYGDSGELCAQIVNAKRADIFMCHDPFMPWAKEKGAIAEYTAVAYFNPVIVVPKGNPKKITDLEAMSQKGLRIGFGDMHYSTCGEIMKQVMAVRPYGSNLLQNVVMENKSHAQRCNDVTLGLLDAAVVWDAVANLFTNKLDVLPVDLRGVDAITSATYKKTDVHKTGVTIGLTKVAENNAAARRFYEFAKTKGPPIMASKGYSLAPAKNE
jgi:molybdenum ABC transporter molybdate-binding protein